jgi:hypothetical protein
MKAAPQKKPAEKPFDREASAKKYEKRRARDTKVLIADLRKELDSGWANYDADVREGLVLALASIRFEQRGGGFDTECPGPIAREASRLILLGIRRYLWDHPLMELPLLYRVLCHLTDGMDWKWKGGKWSRDEKHIALQATILKIVEAEHVQA